MKDQVHLILVWRKNLRKKLSLLIIGAILLLQPNSISSYQPTKIKPPPREKFHLLSPSSVPDPIYDNIARIPSHSPRKIIDQVDPKPIIVYTTPIPKEQPRISSGNSHEGYASWYCLSGKSRCTVGHPSGYYAAIRKDLLYLRGSTVSVCTSSKCINVTIIDCNCGPNANLIDLYSDAFRVLAPLSQGKVLVTVSE